MSTWVDRLARSINGSSLSRRELMMTVGRGVALAAIGRSVVADDAIAATAAYPYEASKKGLHPGDACPPPIKDGEACAPIPCSFRGTHLKYVGKGDCVIHPAFAKKITAIDSCAELAGVTVKVVSAGRSHIPPGGAKCSGHLAGHALDWWLEWREDGDHHVCKGAALSKHPCTDDGPLVCLCKTEIERNQALDPDYPPGVFVDCLRKKDLRWGGDFKTPDPVHVDDACVGCNNQCWKDARQLMETSRLVCCDGRCERPGTCGGTYWCPCNETCYDDVQVCLSNCHVGLGCFNDICGEHDPCPP